MIYFLNEMLKLKNLPTFSGDIEAHVISYVRSEIFNSYLLTQDKDSSCTYYRSNSLVLANT